MFPRMAGNTGNSRELLGNWSLFNEKFDTKIVYMNGITRKGTLLNKINCNNALLFRLPMWPPQAL